MKRVLLLLVLAGCASGPVKIGRVVDLATLPTWNNLVTADGKALACRFCGQPTIKTQAAVDASGHYCLLNHCTNCGGSYLTGTVVSTTTIIVP